ncbi:hypothetical protein HY030_02900 [Candidatus Gottesmanbacteria bacterium]|nr:hypothetical protein [Candidatus Gottesmanbacteria bacterium]
MKILVFTEGTILMHGLAKNLNREEIVRQSKEWGIRQEERNVVFTSASDNKVEVGSVGDYASYIPNSNSVAKLTNWKNQDATIFYLTSRRIKSEIEGIKNILEKYRFPDSENLFFRQQGEDYKDVAERILPDVLIEDDCESIGGEKEMTHPHIRPDLKVKIKSIVVKEFGGIDDLANNTSDLVETK